MTLLTSNEICSFPRRISSSWRPSLFFWGHFASSSLPGVLLLHFAKMFVGGRKLYFMISLSLMIRLISLIIRELTHTSCFIVHASQLSFFFFFLSINLASGSWELGRRTFFPDQGVITVIRVIGVTSHCAAAIAQNTEIEF